MIKRSPIKRKKPAVKGSKFPSPKSESVSKLKIALDKVFSLYIRQKEADHRGFVKCYTCSKVDHWKSMHCGHYISRRHLSTRWEEKNCKVQCVGCNIFNQGAGPAFAIHLLKDYGPDILSILEIKKNNIFRAGAFELRALIEEYKEKLSKL